MRLPRLAIRIYLLVCLSTISALGGSLALLRGAGQATRAYVEAERLAAAAREERRHPGAPERDPAASAALDQRAARERQALLRRLDRSRYAVAFLGAVLLLSMVGIATYLVLTVTRRLRGINAVLAAAAGGDLTHRPRPRPVRPDELDQLAESVDRTIAAQRGMVERIVAASACLNATAAALHEESKRQQVVMSGQSERMQAVSVTLSSLLGNSAHIAGAARGVLDAAERSNDMADTTVRRIEELTGHTRRIADLLAIIQEVSERSDILALNASLEATRAGSSGAAFALVAQEMRRLSERVAASVQDVKRLLTDVHASSASTALATSEGRRLTESTAASSREISAVTDQQRGAMEDLSQAMVGVSGLVADAVLRGEQLRGSAEALRGQADQLAQAVGSFLLEPAFRPAAAAGAAPGRKPRGYEGVGHETIGSDILAVLDAVDDPAEILGADWRRRLAAVRPDGWYPIADLLSLMELLAARVGQDGLRKLGRKLFRRSHEPRARAHLRSARDVVYGIDGLYHSANRGQRIGGWRVLRFERGRAELEKTTPHQCQMEEGILLQALAMVGVPATIEQIQCFRRGGDCCHFVLRSPVTDQRWGGAPAPSAASAAAPR